MPGYTFKFWSEVGFAAGVAAITFALAAVANTEAMGDPRTYFVALGAGAVRAGAGAALAALRGGS